MYVNAKVECDAASSGGTRAVLFIITNVLLDCFTLYHVILEAATLKRSCGLTNRVLVSFLTGNKIIESRVSRH